MALKVKKRYPVPRRTRAHHTLPQRTLKREQRRASAKRTFTTFLVLGIVAVIGGAGYTWYMGKQNPVVASESTTPVVTKRIVAKPHKIASDAAIGASVQSYTPEVKPGENASVTIRSNPEAECAIVVKYNNVPTVDSGLAPKIADEFGVASWAWTVKPGTPDGVWPAEVTCKNKKNSAFVKAEFKVNSKMTSVAPAQ